MNTNWAPTHHVTTQSAATITSDAELLHTFRKNDDEQMMPATSIIPAINYNTLNTFPVIRGNLTRICQLPDSFKEGTQFHKEQIN